MSKQKFYNLSNLLKTESQYKMLLGERSNGKSYAVKEYVLNEAYKNNNQFAYIRRWREDIKSASVESYFADMDIEKITNGEYNYITVYRGNIYFSNNIDGVITKGKIVGFTFCLTGETHYKSLAYPNVVNAVFEEFITKSGYLPNEVKTLESLISTIFRRRNGNIFLIGNTLSRLCPYFSEWQLTHVPKQKQGTIDIYNHYTDQADENGKPIIVSIAVEYCANNSNNTKLFFGNSKMTVSGEWETEEHPHLENRYNSYKKHYELLYEYKTFSFVITLLSNEKKEPFLYVYPYTKERIIKRKITDKFSTEKMTTRYLCYITKYDKLVKDLIEEKKIVFSDNLTGTEFFQSIKEKGGI